MSKVGGSNTAIPAALATLVQSAICRTKVRPRPYPSLFYFPGLNTQPVWKPEQFPFTKQLEASYNDILTEYQHLRSLKVKSDYGSEEQKLHSGQWDWFSYVSKGKRQADFAVNCPKTVELLESFQSPRLMTGTPFSFAFFSTMHANSSIHAHTSPCNLRVRCHFPLLLPKEGDFGIRIGNEKVRWEVGKALYFDDAYEHEVWNKTNEERVILLFDMWHPDLHDDEIDAVQDMFEEAKKKGWLK